MANDILGNHPPTAAKDTLGLTFSQANLSNKVITDSTAAPMLLLHFAPMRSPSPTLRERARWLRYRVGSVDFATQWLNLKQSLHAYGRLMRLDRPIGTYLLLWPMLWALWLASAGKPEEHVFIVFVLGVVLTRSAGCVINDFADRHLDGHVKRTHARPLATGEASPLEALLLFAALALLAFGLVLTLNIRVVQMSFVGVGLMVTYPFFKRFFPAPQFYMGLAFSWSIPMCFMAQTGQTPRLCWLLFAATVVWATAYDTMYAMVDRQDDLRIGIKSSAILFGDADRVIIGVLQLMALLALWLAGLELKLGSWYQLGLAAAACFALYQQWLIRHREPENCFKAFSNNNYYGLVIFVGIGLEYLFKA